MSCCPDKCHTCKAQVQEEWKAIWKSPQCTHICRLGPHPDLMEEEKETDTDGDSKDTASSMQTSHLNQNSYRHLRPSPNDWQKHTK
jgi:hypothetical protein